jgi:hypothetical protein
MDMSAISGSNLGFAVYRKGEAPGTLEAVWSYENTWGGPGHATGGPEEGFVGRYHIRYFLESGEFSDEYDLVIEKSGAYFELSWLVHEEVQAVGFGVELDGTLAVGWRRVG